MAFPTSGPAALEARVMLATFVVNTNLDAITTVDETDGLVSLREAIIAANTNQAFGDAQAGDEEGDVIVFEGGLFGAFGLFAGDRTIELIAELEITDDLVIETPDTFFEITIDGGGANRIFSITETAGSVVIDDLTLTNGFSDQGGAIRNQSQLDVIDVVFTDNVATDRGGAILNDVGAVLGVANSEFTGNSVTGDDVDGGGAIASFGDDLVVLGSTFTDNTALGGDGGAIRHVSLDTSFDVFGSTFVRNVAGDRGGAIFVAQATGAIQDSAFRFNVAGGSDTLGEDAGSGGAVNVGEAGTIGLVSSDFLFNAAATSGGAVSVGELALVQIINTSITFSAVPLLFGAGLGGGIFNEGDVQLTDSTVSFGLARDGGGVFTDDEASTIFPTSQFGSVFLNLLNNFGGPGEVND